MAAKTEMFEEFNSDNFESDDAGNSSENDEINTISKFKKRVLASRKVEGSSEIEYNEEMEYLSEEDIIIE